jgi:hypothetical protein
MMCLKGICVQVIKLKKNKGGMGQVDPKFKPLYKKIKGEERREGNGKRKEKEGNDGHLW